MDAPIFSCLLVGMHMLAKARELSWVLCFLQLAAFAERTYWTQSHTVKPQTYNLPKMIPWYSSNVLTEAAQLFQLVQENNLSFTK